MKNYKNIFYLLYPSFMSRNLFQYVIGSLFFFVAFKDISYTKLFLGAAAFLLSYTFVYYLNDFVDYKKDMKDRDIRTKKVNIIKSPVFTGAASKENLVLASAGMLSVGLFLSYLVGGMFLPMILLLIFLNVLHTTPALKKISLFVIPNMFVIQLIKFSIGWFVQTADVTALPYWIIITFSGVYVFSYKVHKHSFHIRNISAKEMTGLAILGAFTIFSFIVSIFMYDIILPLLVTTLFIAFMAFVVNRSKAFNRRISIGSVLTYAILMIFIVSLLTVEFNPFLFKINSQLSQRLNENNSLKEFLSSVNVTLAKSIVTDMSRYNLTVNDVCNLVCR